MESNIVLLGLKFALLVLVWLFVLSAVVGMGKSFRAAAGAGRTIGAGAAGSGRGEPHQILLVGGPQSGQRFDLAGQESVTIGRDEDCFVRLTDDYVSTTHARLFSTAGGWYVEDLASRNGTSVGGHPITEPEHVTAGTDITIGQTTVRLVT